MVDGTLGVAGVDGLAGDGVADEVVTAGAGDEVWLFRDFGAIVCIAKPMNQWSVVSSCEWSSCQLVLFRKKGKIENTQHVF